MTENTNTKNTTVESAVDKQHDMDTAEMINLMSKSVVSMGDVLDGINTNVNGVGHQAVELHKESQSVMDALTVQDEDLKDIKQSQEHVQQVNEKLVKSVNQTNDAFKNNDQVLNKINDTLKDNEQNNTKRHDEIVNLFKTLQESNDHGVNHLLKQIAALDETVKKTDTAKQIGELTKNMTDVNGLIDHLAGIAKNNDQKLEKRFNDVIARLDDTTTKLDQVANHANNLNTSFDQINGQLDTVTMQLSAIGKSAHVDFTKSNKSSQTALKTQVADAVHNDQKMSNKQGNEANQNKQGK